MQNRSATNGNVYTLAEPFPHGKAISSQPFHLFSNLENIKLCYRICDKTMFGKTLQNADRIELR